MFQVTFGLICSPEMYEKCKKILRNFRFYIPGKNNLNNEEDLWFMFIPEGEPILCKDVGYFNYDKFVNAGLLSRVEDIDTTNAIDLYEILIAKINDKVLYINYCNILRDKIVFFLKENHLKYRWCGAEYESLFKKEIFTTSSYIVGNKEIGRYYDFKGDEKGEYVQIGDDALINLALERLKDFNEDGQRKLFSCMFSFAQTRDIIYIGGSPGLGWQEALKMLDKNIIVYNFDPGPCEKIYPNVVHIKKKVKKIEDIVLELKKLNCINKTFDFIWDVRGETSEEDYLKVDEIIEGEIEIYNNIISSLEAQNIFSRCQIKVNIHNLNKYLFPENVRLYVQPFCLTRSKAKGIKELRAVFLMEREISLKKIHSDVNGEISNKYNILMEERVQYEKEYDYRDYMYTDNQLFVNLMTSRGDFEDFMLKNIPNDVDIDVCLFCINWNEDVKIEKYLNMLLCLKKEIIGSFFIEEKLSEDEFIIDEIKLFLNNKISVFDTRSIINKKLYGLYIFASGLDINKYSYEIYNSETYIIKNIGSKIFCELGSEKYDLVRNSICNRNKYNFIKFPMSYSLSEQIVSPSGHAARMIYAFLIGKGISLSILVYKIIYSFTKSNISRRFIKNRWKENTWNKIFDKLFQFKAGNAERSPKEIWHSITEWKLGIETGIELYKLRKNYNKRKISIVESIINIMDNIVSKEFIGMEIKELYVKNNYQYENKERKLNEALKRFGLNQRSTIKEIFELLIEQVIALEDKYLYNVIISHNIKSDIKIIALEIFNIDKYIMNYFIHTSFILYLSEGKYKDHDIDKLSSVGLLNLSMFMKTKDKKYLKFHYSLNKHHPEYFIDEEGEVISEMDSESIEELCYDIAARRWEFDLMFNKVIYGQMLWDIEKYIKKRNLDMIYIKDRMQELFPKNKEYYLSKVRNIFEKRTKGRY